METKKSQPPALRWTLREVMARKKITNRELAKRLGIHETSVARLKAGDRMPRIDGQKLESICRALECKPMDLLLWDEGE